MNDKYPGAPKRFWMVRVGTRVGYNDEGVFLHENHEKRYFGIEPGTTSVALMHGVEENVPRVNAKGERQVVGNKTDQILGKMLHHLPTLSDEMRYRVLKASFVRADRNGNGKLSRPELGIVFRRILNTMSSKDIEEVIREADEDGDGQINYQEFIDWLQRSNEHPASGRVQKAFGTALRNEADIVRATFRLWDKNGDGLVPDAHLARALAKVHPDLSETQVNALVKTIDCDHDGNVDYDEFVDFLFHKANSR
jgi:Ca2+-binding EF-hand superfamily protein